MKEIKLEERGEPVNISNFDYEAFFRVDFLTLTMLVGAIWMFESAIINSTASIEELIIGFIVTAMIIMMTALPIVLKWLDLKKRKKRNFLLHDNRGLYTEH